MAVLPLDLEGPVVERPGFLVLAGPVEGLGAKETVAEPAEPVVPVVLAPGHGRE